MSSTPAALERAHPRGVPAALAGLCGALVLIGVVAFAYGLTSDAETAWRAFHVNFLYWAGLAQGGVVISAIFVTVGATWPGPVKRIAEGLSAFVPVSFLLGTIGLLFGKAYIYPWLDNPPEAKAAWLNGTRLVVTDVGVLGLLAVVTVAFLYHSVRPTLKGAASQPGVPMKGMYERWAANWRGDAEETAHSLLITKRIAPPLLLLFAYGYSVIAFDQVMSLEPTWYSNLFGAYFAWGGFLSAVAATALCAVLYRNAPGFEGLITPGRLHDLGKMIFAFSVFWMYLFWSQYLVIWYGNLPEETSFIARRLGEQFLVEQGNAGWAWNFSWDRMAAAPYGWLSMIVWGCCWVVPFWVLLGQRPKKTPAILGAVSLVVLVGFWLERNVLVWPSLAPDNGASWIGPVQCGIALGFLGAFVFVFLQYTRIFPSLALPERR